MSLPSEQCTKINLLILSTVKYIVLGTQNELRQWQSNKMAKMRLLQYQVLMSISRMSFTCCKLVI